MFQECQIIEDFEQAVARYAGAPYAVAVDTGSSAIFLACKFLEVTNVTIPKFTFIGVPTMIRHAGGTVNFHDNDWTGEYRLKPYPIVDSCCRFKRDMFEPGTFRCLSFQYWHHLNIGRGGMILTSDSKARDWFRRARFWGRDPGDIEDNPPHFLGWQMFMEPERAARGLSLMQRVPNEFPDMKGKYCDLSQLDVFRK